MFKPDHCHCDLRDETHAEVFLYNSTVGNAIDNDTMKCIHFIWKGRVEG